MGDECDWPGPRNGSPGQPGQSALKDGGTGVTGRTHQTSSISAGRYWIKHRGGLYLLGLV